MQEWQRDPKKMNFVITMNNTTITSGAKSGASTPVQEDSNTIVGDINLFLEDEELDTGGARMGGRGKYLVSCIYRYSYVFLCIYYT